MRVSSEDRERGTRLRDSRRRSGLKQKDVCGRLGVSKTTLYRWENGLMYPREHLDELATLYSVTREYLAFGDRVVSMAAFDTFLKWLDTAPERSSVQPWMVEALRAIASQFPDGRAPTPETYKRLLFAMFSVERS